MNMACMYTRYSDDILYIGPDRYKITDLEELDNDMISGYMTYYRD